MDNWKHRSKGMKCRTCMYFVPKVPGIPGVAEAQAEEVEKIANMTAEKIASKLGGQATLRHDLFREKLGRCRQSAPTMKGWPAVFESDWCGDHKLDENKL